MGKVSTPPPIKVETEEMIWQIEETLYNRSLDDLRQTAKCMPAPWQFENVENALILYLKSTAGMLPRLVVKINEELMISAAYHGWFTAEAEVLREIDVRRMPLSDILQTVENFPICEGVEVENFTALSEATIAKHKKTSYKFVSSTPILPGPSKPELVSIRSKACEIFLRAGKKCAWCTTTQLRIKRDPRLSNHGKAVSQQDPKNSVTFVRRYSFSRNNHDKLQKQDINLKKVLTSRAQYGVADAKVRRKEECQRDQPMHYKILSGPLMVPSFQTVSILTPKLPTRQQSSDGITVSDGTEKTVEMLDFPVQTPSSTTARTDNSDKLSTTLCTASSTQSSADKSHAVNLISEGNADTNHLGTPIMGERTKTLEIARKHPQLSVMSEHCLLEKAVETTSDKKQTDFRTFLENNGIASHHIDKLEENDIDSDIFTTIRDKEFWQMFSIGITHRLLKLQKPWQKLLTKAAHRPCDQLPSLTESDTTLPTGELVRDDVASRPELGACLPIDESVPLNVVVESSTTVMQQPVVAREDETESRSDVCADEMPSSSTKHSKPKPAPMPLPEFSYKVQNALKAHESAKFIRLVVGECASHILKNGDINSKSAYRKFGKSVVEKYPCLKSTLQHPPWKNFNKKLSQKLRTARLLRHRTGTSDIATS